MCRVLSTVCLLFCSQGSWVLATKWWLPLQLLVFILGVLGSERFQVRFQVLWSFWCGVRQCGVDIIT